MGWTTLGHTFPSPDGTPLFAYEHLREVSGPRRVLLVVHGQGEHGGRYSHFPYYLADVIDSVVCLDLRGHGRSGGKRGHAGSFEDYLDDVQAAYTYFIERQRAQVKAAHFFAHSMGGLIGLRALQSRPALQFVSASISSPLLRLKMKVPALKKYPAYVLARVWGSIQMSNGLDAKDVSHDPEVVATYRRDPLVHDRVTPSWFVSLLKTMEQASAALTDLRCPTQFLIATGDPIVDSQWSQQVFDHLRAPEKKLCLYERYYHEPVNEGGADPAIRKERVFDDIKAWIQKYSSSKATNN